MEDIKLFSIYSDEKYKEISSSQERNSPDRHVLHWNKEGILSRAVLEEKNVILKDPLMSGTPVEWNPTINDTWYGDSGVT